MRKNKKIQRNKKKCMEKDEDEDEDELLISIQWYEMNERKWKLNDSKTYPHI